MLEADRGIYTAELQGNETRRMRYIALIGVYKAMGGGWSVADYRPPDPSLPRRHMSEQTKKVALPAYLPRRLQAFRIVQGDHASYLLRDKLLDKTHDLEPWQFFVLEVLPGCEDVAKLRSVFEDRFGRQISEPEILKFFGWLADNKLLDEESAAHPLLKPFTRQGYALEQGLVKPKSFQELSAMMAPATARGEARGGATGRPAAAGGGRWRRGREGHRRGRDASGRHQRSRRPRPAARRPDDPAVRAPACCSPGCCRCVRPLRWVVYLMPFLFLSALILSVRYAPLGYDDLATLHDLTDLAVHALVSLFTINIAAVLTQAFVAQNFRASVGPLSIGFRFGFFPRFTVRDPAHRAAVAARAHVAARRPAADATVPVQRRHPPLVQHPRQVPRSSRAPGCRSPSCAR